MDLIDGSVWSFSQFSTVQGLTPSRSAACFWVNLNSSRRFLTCSPKVCGSKSVSFGFNALSRMGTNCKRATRPCMCGYLGHYNGRCHCTPDQVLRYRSKISGPLLDRIDIHIEVPAVPAEDLTRVSSGDASSAVRARVEQARANMIARQGKENARLTTREIDSHCTPDRKGATLLMHAISRLGLSARAYHRILKLARTIADVAGVAHVSDAHVAEAIQFRRFDRA